MDNEKNPGKTINQSGVEDAPSAEARLAELLEEGDPQRLRPEAEALRRLSPRYEVRIAAERDPVAEETNQYRNIAEEIDGRYDRFVPRDGS